MREKSITKVRVEAGAQLPLSDWTEVAKLTDDEIEAAAACDPDAQPAKIGQLKRSRRITDVKAIREKYGLTQEAFANRFGLKLENVQAWESGLVQPDHAAVTLLRVIWAEPEAVRRALAAE